MKTIISAIAGGRNLFVLLAFAIIGFSLVITPSLESLGGDVFSACIIAFGWNAFAALLVVGLFRIVNEKHILLYSPYSWFYGAIVCGSAAILGVLLQ